MSHATWMLHETAGVIPGIYEKYMDIETGEIEDEDGFRAEYEAAVRSSNELKDDALNYIKTKIAEREAIANEKKKLDERMKVLDRQIEKEKQDFAEAMNGEKYKSAIGSISYRDSERVEVTDEFIAWAIDNDDTLIRYKDPEVNKKDLKKRLEAGEDIPYARVESNRSVIIK